MLVILGNQLFPLESLPGPRETPVFMAEDVGLCTYVRHHQQKIVLFLAAMRNYADELRDAGYQVYYTQLKLNSPDTYEDKLEDALKKSGCARLLHFEIEDKAMEQRLDDFASRRNLPRRELPSPMFTCSREEFRAFAADNPRLLMGDFYRWQRRRLDILIDGSEPVGGRWTFDSENRKKLPRSVRPPPIPWAKSDKHVGDVIGLVEQNFATHPGRATDFQWPTKRKQAREWLDDFVSLRLAEFGPYEDALTTRSETVFHSLLSPYLNTGLLTPAEVIDAVLAKAADAPIQSVEGFVRQVIGWREFIRGIYREYSDEQENRNFWRHQREMTADWYTGNTGIAPLDDTIRTAQSLGWTHHIPRLMVLGNLMTLCEIHPRSAHRYFMEMFIDSSEWVMGPNVYGMALFSDGGIFATKPYICGSNYLLKMSDYSRGEWCDTVDGLYWRFIHKHRNFFSANPRLSLMPKALDRLNAERREHIFGKAEGFLGSFTRT